MSTRMLCCLVPLAITGCASTPETRYYTLSADAVAAHNMAVAPTIVYAVDSIAIPDMLDRPQIVVRSRVNTVDIQEYDRWAGPLADQLQRVLVADLSIRLGRTVILDPGLPLGRADRRIAISILTFEPARSGESTLAASWSVFDVKKEASRHTRTFSAHYSDPTSRNDISSLVGTMSELTAKLADDVAASLTMGN
jgi:uncharacterized lipoprotein YmbA